MHREFELREEAQAIFLASSGQSRQWSRNFKFVYYFVKYSFIGWKYDSSQPPL